MQQSKNEELEELLKKFIFPYCQKNKNHQTLQMNLISLEETSSNYFEPLCIDCVIEKNMKDCKITSLQKVIAAIICELENGEHKKQESWLEITAKKFRILSEICMKFSLDILEIKRQYFESDLSVFTIIKQNLKQFFKEPQSKQNNLSELKNYIMVKDDLIKFNSYEINNICKKFQAYKSTIEKIEEDIMIQLKKLEQVNFELPILYDFIKSEWQQSNEIIEQEKGKVFQGTGNGFQTIVSNLCFQDGAHQVILRLKNLKNFMMDHLYIGLIQEQQKYGYPGVPNPYKCLFCDSQNGMTSYPQNQIIGAGIKEGDIIIIQLDFQNNEFNIIGPEQRVIYKLDRQYQIQEKQWRFQISQSSNSKVTVQILQAE